MPKLRPKIILFLIGKNDVAREVGMFMIKVLSRMKDFEGGIKGYIKSLTPYSKVVSTALNVIDFMPQRIKGWAIMKLTIKV